MFKYMIMSFLVLATIRSHADGQKACLENLTDNYSYSTRHFKLYDTDVEREFGKDHLAQSIAAIRVLIDKEGCKPKSINFGKGTLGRSSSRCRQLSTRVEESVSCFVESNLGYFFVTRNFESEYHIVFNRWD